MIKKTDLSGVGWIFKSFKERDLQQYLENKQPTILCDETGRYR